MPESAWVFWPSLHCSCPKRRPSVCGLSDWLRVLFGIWVWKLPKIRMQNSSSTHRYSHTHTHTCRGDTLCPALGLVTHHKQKATKQLNSVVSLPPAPSPLHSCSTLVTSCAAVVKLNYYAMSTMSIGTWYRGLQGVQGLTGCTRCWCSRKGYNGLVSSRPPKMHLQIHFDLQLRSKLE